MRKEYKNITKLKYPPNVILTRWGTWLTAVKFYQENREIIKTFILQTNSLVLMEIIDNIDFISEFNMVMKYFMIPIYIKELEKDGLTVPEQLSIINQFRSTKIKSDIKKN